MKISVSVSEQEIALLDHYVASAGLKSRSAALQHAIRLLRHSELEDDYAAAFGEWDAAGDKTGWDKTTVDGLADAPR